MNDESNEQAAAYLPEMKSMLVAVFGHYDSRGGTTGMPIPEATEGAVREAIRQYNKAFGWEEELEAYRKWKERQATGEPNPKGEFDWAWDPTEPDSSPGDADFMYIALLYYPEDAPMEGDLEEAGTVILASNTDPGDPTWTTEPENWPTSRKIAKSIEHLTMLEFIELEGGRYGSQGDRDDAEWEAWVLSKARVIIGGEREIPSWNDDAFGFIIGTGL